MTPAILLDALKKEMDKRRAESNLYDFVTQAWPAIEPGIPFIPSWHIEVICDHLQAITEGDIRRLLVNIPPRHALAVDTIIPTTKGKKLLSDLVVGDCVFGVDGRPISVKGKSDVFAGRQIYRVTTDDGAYVDVDADHLWTVRLGRKYKSLQTYTTDQLWQRQNGAFLRTKRGGGVELRTDTVCTEKRAPMLPSAGPVQYPYRDLIVDPYVLGLWLGNGTKTCGEITLCDDAQIIMPIIASKGYKTIKRDKQYSYYVYGLMQKLRIIGVLNNKHIPDVYMRSSIEQRKELLRGLMDTDGNVSKKGQCFFSQSNYSFILQVAELIRSLGIKASIQESEAKIYEKSYGKTWRVSFYANNISKLPRKESRTLTTKRTFGRYIRIEKLDRHADTQCITVDSDDGLFQAGDGYIVTHNSKSTIISVAWCCWEWICRPEEKFLCASYSGALSIRDNLKARRLVQSPWYQDRWGDVFRLAGDQNAKQRFENDKTGYRIATSVGGTATGEGGSRLVIDDPHGSQDAQSDALRETAVDWFNSVWSTRLNDPKKDAMVVVMQRLHEQDVSGHILSNIGGWEHILIPAEWDGVRRKTILGPYDPRSTVGELICPERFGHAEITRLKQSLGEYGSSGQLQQDPTPTKGGILKTKYLRLWTGALPQLEYVIQSYDCAFTEKTSGDPTACTVWGIFTYKGEHNILLLDAWAEHLSYPDLRKRAIDDYSSEYGGCKTGKYVTRARKPDRVIVEAKASGQSLLQDLRLARVPAFGYNPGNSDKISRAHQAAPTLELGLIWIPESPKNPGQFVSWASDLIKEMAKFPVAEHDDLTDSATQVIIYLKNEGWLDLPQAKDPDEIVVKRKDKVNPYGI